MPTEQLTTLAPLSNLRVLGGELIIDSADGLTSLHGLENLEEIQSNGLFSGKDPIDRGISIAFNKNLEDISAFSQLKSTRYNLHISHNPKLKTLKGLEGFEKVGRYLVIQDNSSLADISALGNLKEVTENTIIVRNKSLNNLEGLENLEKTAAVEITNNGNLPNLLDLAALKAYFE